MSHDNRITRRRFMQGLLAAGTALGPLSPLSPWFGLDAEAQEIPHLLKDPQADFFVGRIYYRGGDYNADMLTEGLKGGSEINLMKRLALYTSIQTEPRETVVRLVDPVMFTVPFFYMTGHGIMIYSREEIDNLRKALTAGAFLLGDACNGKGHGFDRSFRELVRRLFPEKSLQPLSMKHPVFNSFFQINKVLGGDKFIDPFVEGLEVNNRLAILYTVNDLGCAWEGHPCRPGGEEQRDHAFRMGINSIVYSMTH